MKLMPSQSRALSALLSCLLISVSGCADKHSTSNNSHDRQLAASIEHRLSLPSSEIRVGSPIKVEVNPSSLSQKFKFVVKLDAPYATLSILSGNKMLANNINIASEGVNTLNLILEFEKIGKQTLSLIARGATINLLSAELLPSNIEISQFKDISAEIGLVTEETYKYGGPAIADFGNDGDYDFALNNHNFIPTQLVENFDGKKVSITKLFPGPMDYHGSSFGDYDLDGDLDLMVAFGGGNGTNPTSYALMQNNDGQLTNVTSEVGINIPTRGRSPRWIDFDQDGDLDIGFFNAKRPNYDGAQQVFFRNKGDGTFELVDIPDLGHAPGERVALHDFNNDGKTDILLYFPVSLWRNDGDFKFTNVTDMFPESVQDLSNVVGATDVDINNDGLQDLYFARGKTAYQLSRKSIDFNPQTKRIDVRDDGEKGTTAIDFTAQDTVRLSHMELTFRQYWDGFAVFLGEQKTRKIVKAKGFQVTQLPEEMKTAADFLDINKQEAQGWPEKRDVNGLYIGHISDDHWRAEWVRNGNIYWQVTFSLTGVNTLNYDWIPNNRNEQDVLLLNQGDHYIDVSKDWNIPQGGNHAGVTHGDFNNDGWTDLFVYRYGFLKERVNDLLLMNTGNGSFEISTEHGARVAADPGHGDMGQAFDFDLDGRVDMLNGSEEEGHWYLFKNTNQSTGNYVLIDVGYSPKQGIDSYFAKVKVTTKSGKQYLKHVSSAGAIHAQSQLSIVHFGLGDETKIDNIDVQWRNGETMTFNDVQANSTYTTPK
ncbi:CRTAC1 family protein [Paraglaciecola sp.]|uniref:CRTAC1 family protein n=1 Tax=Paraglaciecola sp. TaxID=1920173 RepID=UPI003EF28338